MTTVGYGDIYPTGTHERLYVIFAMLLGGAYFGFMIAHMAALARVTEASKKLYRDKIAEVRSYVTRYILGHRRCMTGLHFI